MLTNSHKCRPSCQNEWAVDCRPRRRWWPRRSAKGSFCPPPPVSSQLGTQTESQTREEKTKTSLMSASARTGLTNILWQSSRQGVVGPHTVLRLLNRCFGASWPLQFFTYMLQLNSPSLQPTRHTLSQGSCLWLLTGYTSAHMSWSIPLGNNSLCPFFSHQLAGFRSHESALAQKS